MLRAESTMPRTRGFVLGKSYFHSKKDARNRARKILKKFRDSGRPGKAEGSDFSFLCALVNKHVDGRRKVGPGIREITAGPSSEHPQCWCFLIHRLDDEVRTFSINSCMEEIYPTNIRTLRKMILPQISEFRNRVLERDTTTSDSFVSELSDAHVALEDMHIDHAPPEFREIVELFAKDRNLNLRNTLLATAEKHNRDEWVYEDFPEDFCAFHATVAQLRAVSRRENLALELHSRKSRSKK